MVPPAKQTPKHVFKALRIRRLASPEQGDVLGQHLRWRSVHAKINACAIVHRNLHSTLAVVAALITAAPTSTPEHGTLSDPATPECERAVIIRLITGNL